MRVLVIDDSRAMLAILRNMMSEIGFEVATEQSGPAGLKRLDEGEPFDLVLVDWNMPVQSGYEFVCEVRGRPSLSRVKLIMVTTETERGRVVDALEAGADEYVMKPFTKATLIEKLDLVGLAPEKSGP
jgi:two-component system chemotaxis response regulator CheY